MEIQVTELEHCKLQVSCVAEQSEIDKKRNEVVKVFKHAPMPGFRKGKASIQAIKHYYKNQIEDSVKRALAEEAFHNSIIEKAIKPLGNPQFTELFLHQDKFSCQFIVHDKPKFDLVDLTSLEVPKPHQTASEEDVVQQTLQNVRVEQGEKVPYQEGDFVQSGDSVTISYDAFVDGEKKDNLSSEGDLITIGASKLPYFDDNLLGMKPGDTKEFNVPVSEKSSNEFAGKTITFKVTLHMGMKAVPANLDDELAKKMGKESYSELEQFIRAEVGRSVQMQRKTALQQAIIAKLVASHDFKVPDWLTLSEAKYLATAAKVNWDTLNDQIKEAYMAQAAKNVKLTLILDKVRDNEPEAQLADHEVVDIVKSHLNLDSGMSLEDTLKELNKLGYLQVLYNRIRDEYTLDFVVKTVKVIE